MAGRGEGHQTDVVLDGAGSLAKDFTLPRARSELLAGDPVFPESHEECSVYLHDQGVRMLGIDLSPRMIDSARQRSPDIEFRVGDMRALDLPAGALAGIVAFYSLIHIDEHEMGATLRELRRHG